MRRPCSNAPQAAVWPEKTLEAAAAEHGAEIAASTAFCFAPLLDKTHHPGIGREYSSMMRES